MIIAIIIIGIILIIALWYIATMNKLRQAEVKIEEADSGIDVALTKRYDVLTKMLDVVKGYTKHESETFAKIVELRKGMTMAEKSAANASMDAAMKSINVVAENYPELRSSENYKELQISINDVEEHLQAARRIYNSNVSYLNRMIVSFPASIVASNKGITKKEFFEAEEAKKADVKMEF